MSSAYGTKSILFFCSNNGGDKDMRCTTVHYIDAVITKGIHDLLQQHIPHLVKACHTAQYFACICIHDDIVCHVQSPTSVFERDSMRRVLQPIFRQMRQTGKAVVIYPYLAWPLRIPDPDFDTIRHIAVFPVQYAGNLAGSIGIAFAAEGTVLHPHEIQLIQELIDMYAQFILGCRNITFSIPETGIWIYNTENSMLTMGRELCDICGITTACGTTKIAVDEYIKKFVYPDDRWKIRQIRKQIRQEGSAKLNEVQHRVVRTDGTVRYILTQGISVKTLDGHQDVCGFTRDITTQVDTEKKKRQHERRIERMAYYDSLTQLPNRRYMGKWLNQEMRLVRKGTMGGIVLFIDIDNLKIVNDTYGHEYGDQLIIATGKCIRDVLGPDAFVAHMSGDEFIAVLHGAYTRDPIQHIVGRLHRSLQKKHEILGISFHLTASIGIAEYPKDGNTTEEILKNVDNAMHAAKKNGKGQYRFYVPAMQDAAFKKIQLLEGVYDAFDNNEFFLVYQPQIAVADTSVIGFEALLRWNSPVYGCISPSQFIPLIGQAGLTRSMGTWIFKTACQFARRLLDQGWNGCVHVNISPMQLAMDDFVDMLFQVMQETRVPLCNMGIEITEDACMACFMSMEKIVEKIRKVTDVGMHLAMDDFGTGYSSLTLLNQLPFDTIKIDKSFIDKIGTTVSDEELVSSIIQMIHAVHKKVVAEGVETEQQLAFLRVHHCDVIQGYVYSKPLTEEKAMEFLLTAQPST